MAETREGAEPDPPAAYDSERRRYPRRSALHRGDGVRLP